MTFGLRMRFAKLCKISCVNINKNTSQICKSQLPALDAYIANLEFPLCWCISSQPSLAHLILYLLSLYDYLSTLISPYLKCNLSLFQFSILKPQTSNLKPQSHYLISHYLTISNLVLNNSSIDFAWDRRVQFGESHFQFIYVFIFFLDV